SHRGANEDDRAAPPGEGWGERTRAQHRSGDIDPEHLVPVVHVELVELAESTAGDAGPQPVPRHDPRAVDEGVDPAVAMVGRTRDPLAVRYRGHIGCYRDGLAAVLADLLGDLLGPVADPVDADDAGAVRREGPRDRLPVADPVRGARAGHHGDLPGQPLVTRP